MNRTIRLGWGVTSAFLAAAPLAAQTSDGCGGGVRFVVAERDGAENNRDAYTLILTEAADIAHARRLIAEGPEIGNAIVHARIGVGGDGVNRNWRAAGAPAWSWHIESFFQFTEVTPEILDYWPAGIEKDPQGWVDSATQGEIGFWMYTVVDEIAAACAADFNCDNATTSADFFEFVRSFFAGDSRADFNGDGVVNSQDFFDYLAAFFHGCN